MSRFLPTLLLALLAIGFLIKAFFGVHKFSSDPDFSFYGPGEYRLVAPFASDFTVWHKSTSTIDGVYSVREPRLPPGAEIVIEHSGTIVPAAVYGSNYTSGDHGDKSSVLRFTANEPGEYVIKVSGFQEKRSFEITRGNGVGPVFAVIGWFLAAGFTFVAFLIFLILSLAKVFPKKSKPARD